LFDAVATERHIVTRSEGLTPLVGSTLIGMMEVEPTCFVAQQRNAFA
jgi:hypothetical protein